MHMLFDLQDMTRDLCSDSIRDAIHALDPAARVEVDRDDRRVRVEGLLTEAQAIAAIGSLGLAALKARPHSGEGSTCCGGCS